MSFGCFKMPVSTSPSSPPQSSDRLLLRWLEGPNAVSREQLVEIVETDTANPLTVIRSAIAVGETTPVYLTGKDYLGNGIVRSCKKEGSHFLLTIDITKAAPEFDPGVLSVQDFLTEDDEEKILSDLENPTPRVGLPTIARIQSWWSFGLQVLQRTLLSYAGPVGFNVASRKGLPRPIDVACLHSLLFSVLFKEQLACAIALTYLTVLMTPGSSPVVASSPRKSTILLRILRNTA
jgi:hypothetical protein